MSEIKNVTVFCGAAKSIDAKYYPEAFRMGELIGEKGMRLVFGIGDNGLMGQVFRGALKTNAPIRGVTTEKLLELQCDDPSLFKEGEIEVVPDLATRKIKMFEEGDIIVVLPGGWGTVDEYSDFAVSIQTGSQKKKPLIFVNMDGFYDGTKIQTERMIKDGTLNEDKAGYVAFVNRVDDVFEAAETLLDDIKETDVDIGICHHK